MHSPGSSTPGGTPRGRRLVAVFALLLAAPAHATWTIDGTRLLADGQPVAVRGLWYPLDARRDGEPLNAADLVATALASGVNLLGLRVGEGPGLDEAVAVLDEAAKRGLAVAVEPRPSRGAPAGRIAARLAARPALALWLAHEPDTAPAGCAVLRLADPLGPAPGAALFRRPALFQPAQSFGRWAEPLADWRAAGACALAELEAVPPDWLIADRLLIDRAPHPDLYRSGTARPQTAAALAGEYLLVPEPAQIRLQVYAALGRGARGVIWDHAGHLAVGEESHSGVARAAELSRLYTELRWIEAFVSEGELRPAPATPPGAAAGLLRVGERHLLLVWRDRRLDTRAVGGPAGGPLTIDLPLDLPAGSRAMILDMAGLIDRPADVRGDRVRVTFDRFDLTAACLLAPASDPVLARSIEQALPDTARRTLVIASERWRQVAETIQRLESHDASAGGRPIMAIAAGLLDEAQNAFRHGYLKSSIERAQEADGAVREAQAVELETALAHRLGGPRADALRLCFPSLPGLFAPRDRPPTGPYPLTPDSPVRLDFAHVGSRWTALAGFDQTVATLHVASAPARLVWQPAAGDPGALYLPFTAAAHVDVLLRMRLGSLSAHRVIGLASDVYEAPEVAFSLAADGVVRAGEAQAAWSPEAWHTARWTVRDGQAILEWDGQTLARQTVRNPVGALVLAAPKGVEQEPITFSDVEITVPQ